MSGFSPKSFFTILLATTLKYPALLQFSSCFFMAFTLPSSWCLQWLSWYKLNCFFLELDLVMLFTPLKTFFHTLKTVYLQAFNCFITSLFFIPAIFNVTIWSHFVWATVLNCKQKIVKKSYAKCETIFTNRYVSVYV